MNSPFNYNLYLICQTVPDSPLRCLAYDTNINHRSDIYESFVADWDKFRSANIPIDVCLPLPEASVVILLKNETKWHRICRREFFQNILILKQKLDKSDQPSTSSAVSCSTLMVRLQRELRKRKQEGTKDTDICLPCEQLDTKDDILHSFEKVEQTEELNKRSNCL